MAVLQLFSVFDVKVGVFAPPFCGRSRGEAIRSFTDACKDESLPFKRHPGDYKLYFMGEFDDNSGIISVSGIPTFILGADEVIIEGALDIISGRVK